MANRTRLMIGWCGATIVGLAATAGGQIGSETPNGAVVMVAIDGGIPMPFAVQFVPPDDGGSARYVGSMVTPDNLAFSLDYVVDDVNNPMLSASGYFQCVNGSGAPRSVDASMSFPVCPATPGGTLLGGTVSILVTTDADGGGMTCAPDTTHVWDVMISDESAHKIFWCPYQMSTTGMGAIQSNAFFGAPVPSLPGPDFASSIGSRNHFRLTAGESVKVTSTLIVKSLGAAPSCFGDINGDGTVDGVDLNEVIARWGEADPTDSCRTGDLNVDGLIDGNDLTLLIGHWGDCGS